MSMGFSRQEYWSGLPHPPPGHLPNPGMEPKSLMSPAWQAGSLLLAPLKATLKEQSGLGRQGWGDGEMGAKVLISTF